MSIAELPVKPVTPQASQRNHAPIAQIDPYATDSDRLFEVVGGVRVEKTMSVVQCLIIANLQDYLVPFSRQNRLGRVVPEMMFAIPGSGNDRKPDVAFVSFLTWPKSKPIPAGNAWPVAPDLAVEAVSPSNSAFEVIAKVREYFTGGVKQVWLIFSNVEQVYVYTSPTEVRILSRTDDLTGCDVVPGFRMPVADLFPPVE